MKKVILLALPAILLFACSKPKNSDVAKLTPAQAKEAVAVSFQSFQSCAQHAKDGDFLAMIREIGGTDMSQYDIDIDYLEELVDVYNETYNEEVEFYEGNRVNPNQFFGIYKWNSAQERFDKTNSNDRFEIHLPAKPENASNLNVVLSVDNFSEKAGKIDSEEYYFPESFRVRATYDGKLIAGITLSDLSVDPSGASTLPVSFLMEVETPPYVNTFSISRRSARDYTVTMNIESDGACKYALSVNGKSNTDTYEDFDPEENLESVSGTLQISQVVYSFSANTKNIDWEGDLSVDELNREISASVKKTNGDKIGDLELVDLGDDEVGINIVYSDGSRQDFIQLLEDELDKLDGTFSDF